MKKSDDHNVNIMITQRKEKENKYYRSHVVTLIFMLVNIH